MLHVNILTRYENRLFDQHIDRQRYEGSITFYENSREDIEWDCVVVFDGLPDKVSFKVAAGNVLFAAGEPPDSITYTKQFLAQFDYTYCAHPSMLLKENNQGIEYFNNWHFGYNPTTKQFRYTFDKIRDLAPPMKHKNMSVIMSNIACMPNHLKRLRLLDAIREHFGDRLDYYGRGHSFIPYKEDAILPYRFHLCIENCELSDLWTEKISDSLLGYAVPVYAGCPNVSKYFPEQSIVKIDINDLPYSLAVIEQLLQKPEEHYQDKLPFMREARERLLYKYNIIHWLGEFLEGGREKPRHISLRTLIPNELTSLYSIENSLLRVKRLLFRKYFQLTNHNRSRGYYMTGDGNKQEPM